MPNLRLPGLWSEIWDNLVDIETHLGLDGLGIESWWGRDFWHRSRVALGHDINHSPTSTAKVKYRVELYVFFPLCDCMASYRENLISFVFETRGAAHSRTNSVSTANVQGTHVCALMWLIWNDKCSTRQSQKHKRHLNLHVRVLSGALGHLNSMSDFKIYVN